MDLTMEQRSVPPTAPYWAPPKALQSEHTSVRSKVPGWAQTLVRSMVPGLARRWFLLRTAEQC